MSETMEAVVMPPRDRLLPLMELSALIRPTLERLEATHG
jgi:hypothetical protein